MDLDILNLENNDNNSSICLILLKQGRNRPLDTPKRMIERRQREGEIEKER